MGVGQELDIHFSFGQFRPDSLLWRFNQAG